MADQQVIHLDDNGNVIVPSPPKVTEPGNDVLHLDDSGNTIGKNGALFEHKPDLQIKGEYSYDPRIVAPNVLAAAGGTAGSLLGGPVGGIAGAGLGSAAGEFLKHEDPTHYSQDGTAPTMEDSALNVGLNTAGEGANQAVTGIVQKLVSQGVKKSVAQFLASKIGSTFPAVKNAITKDTIASNIGKLGDLPQGETIPSNIRSVPRVGGSSTPGDEPTSITGNPSIREAPEGNGQYRKPLWQQDQGTTVIPKNIPQEERIPLWQQEVKVGEGVAPTNTGSVSKQIVAGQARPRDNSQEQSLVNEILSKNTKNGRVTSVEGIQKYLDDPQYTPEKAAGGKYLSQPSRDMLETIQDLSKKADYGESSAKSAMYMAKGALVLGASAVSHPAGAVASGLILGNEALGRMAENPRLMSLMKEVKDLPPDSQKAKLFRQAAMFALRGTTQYMVTPSGEKEQVVISKDGVPQLPR